MAGRRSALMAQVAAGECMTSEAMRNLVEHEIAGDWPRRNSHGGEL
jgi:hypothetical protein